MKNMEIGKSGIIVPSVGMGAWAIGGGPWWGDNDDEVSIRTIHEAIDLGVKWIDTAPVYGLGHSEEVLGRALAGGKREQVILSTKCALHWNDTKEGSYHKAQGNVDIYRDLSPKGIRRHLTDSLKRLNTDYIDILYTHWQSVEPAFVPVEETMGALMDMKKEGLIRAIGASNVTESHIREYIKAGQLDVIQEKYSILERRIESQLFDVCKELGVSIQAYSPLEQGLLTGKVTMETTYSATDVRNKPGFFALENRAKVLAMLDSWKDLTEKYECSLGNLVIAWTGTRNGGLHVLCGARKPAQIEENAQAMKLELDAADAARMDADAKAVIAAVV